MMSSTRWLRYRWYLAMLRLERTCFAGGLFPIWKKAKLLESQTAGNKVKYNQQNSGQVRNLAAQFVEFQRIPFQSFAQELSTQAEALRRSVLLTAWQHGHRAPCGALLFTCLVPTIPLRIYVHAIDVHPAMGVSIKLAEQSPKPCQPFPSDGRLKRPWNGWQHIK